MLAKNIVAAESVVLELRMFLHILNVSLLNIRFESKQEIKQLKLGILRVERVQKVNFVGIFFKQMQRLGPFLKDKGKNK